MPDEDSFFAILGLIYTRNIDLGEETTRECDDPSDELGRSIERIAGHDRPLTESHQIYLFWTDPILLCHFSDICYDTLISPLDISRPIHRCTSREVNWKPSIPPTSEVERSSQGEYRVIIWKIIRQGK
jgi:hypothetical protein